MSGSPDCTRSSCSSIGSQGRDTTSSQSRLTADQFSAPRGPTIETCFPEFKSSNLKYSSVSSFCTASMCVLERGVAGPWFPQDKHLSHSSHSSGDGAANVSTSITLGLACIGSPSTSSSSLPSSIVVAAAGSECPTTTCPLSNFRRGIGSRNFTWNAWF